MNLKVRKHLPFLEYITRLSTDQRQKILKNTKKKDLQIVFDILLNLDRGNLPVEPNLVEQLRPYAAIIAKIIAPRIFLQKRKDTLLKEDLWPMLIAPLLPLLRSP